MSQSFLLQKTDLFLTLTLIFILHNNLASAATEVRMQTVGEGRALLPGPQQLLKHHLDPLRP